MYHLGLILSALTTGIWLHLNSPEDIWGFLIPIITFGSVLLSTVFLFKKETKYSEIIDLIGHSIAVGGLVGVSIRLIQFLLV